LAGATATGIKKEVFRIKAIILCAGYATRLYPLTMNKPKPLLYVGGKPIIEYIIGRLDGIGSLDAIYVVTNDKFSSHFNEWKKGLRHPKEIVIVNDGTLSNEDRLGAIGDIHFVIERERIDDDVLVIGGDNLFEFSLLHLHGFFLKKKRSVVALYDVKDRKLASQYGIVSLDSSHRIIDFQEKPAKPKSTLASTACYIFSKDDITELGKCIREHRKPDNLGDFIKYLSSHREVYGFAFTERWFDIGSHEQLREADEWWSAR